MDIKTQWKLLAASVAGLLAAVGSAGLGRAAQAQAAEADKAPCYGINKS